MATTWLRNAGWWASDYAHVLFWQGRAALNRADPDALRSGTRAPIVVIPGVYESWRFMLPLIGPLNEVGHPVYVVPSLKWNLRPVTDTAAHVAECLDRNDLRGAIIVAHSKGGLIGKYVMSRPEMRDRVKGMVAVATPFGGSVYARFMLAPSLRIFSPEDATIRALADEAEINTHIVSIFGPFDPHIPAGSTLAGAKNVELATGGHFRVLDDPLILAEVDALARA